MKKIFQGAEAVLYVDDDVLVKERIRKGYRIARLDERLRRSRTRLEATLLREARRIGVDTPQISDVSDFVITMDFIRGERVKDILNSENYKEIIEKVAVAVAKMHEYNIIHGDLTTSNMIFKDERVYFIDFGLGFQSSKTEDKAMDLYLFYHVLESTHWQILDDIWKIFINIYGKTYKEAEKVIKTFHEIEKRGRYKER